MRHKTLGKVVDFHHSSAICTRIINKNIHAVGPESTPPGPDRVKQSGNIKT